MARPEIEIELPDLHELQRQIAEDDTRFKIVVAGRRWGKTRLGIAMAIKYALEGGRVWWIAPTYPMAMEGWRDIRQMVYDIESAELQEAQKLINFPGCGQLQIKSADNPQRLRGAGLDFVVLDECAYIKEETWAEIVRPTLTDKQGHALFISTPSGFNWFSRLFDRAKTNDEWKSWQFHTNTNPFIPKDELNSAKNEIGSFLFSQEYEAQFVEAGGGLLKPEWVKYYKSVDKVEYNRIGNETLYKYYEFGSKQVKQDELTIFTCVDLATSIKETADYTAIVTIGETKESELLVLDVTRARVEAPDIIPLIGTVINKFNPVFVGIEKAGFQLSIIQLARRQGIPVKELKADKDKVSRALPLGAKMEGGSVYFDKEASWFSELEKELLQFPLGEHDDQVDALAYAVAETIRKKRYVAY